jgi:hypothetical protein
MVKGFGRRPLVRRRAHAPLRPAFEGRPRRKPRSGKDAGVVSRLATRLRDQSARSGSWSAQTGSPEHRRSRSSADASSREAMRDFDETSKRTLVSGRRGVDQDAALSRLPGRDELLEGARGQPQSMATSVIRACARLCAMMYSGRSRSRRLFALTGWPRRRLASDRRAIGLTRLQLAGQHGEQRIVPQGVVIDAVLMTQRQAKNPLPDQRDNGMLDQPDRLVDAPQQQGPGVGRHRSPVELGDHLAVFDGSEFEQRRATRGDSRRSPIPRRLGADPWPSAFRRPGNTRRPARSGSADACRRIFRRASGKSAMAAK